MSSLNPNRLRMSNTHFMLRCVVEGGVDRLDALNRTLSARARRLLVDARERDMTIDYDSVDAREMNTLVKNKLVHSGYIVEGDARQINVALTWRGRHFVDSYCC